MAFNPFLSMNEPAAPLSTEVLNPFMMTDDPPDFTSNENPFANSNPFSDFGNSYEPPAGDTVPVDIFNTSEPANVGAKQFEEDNISTNIFDTQFTTTEHIIKPNELDLISTIIDDTALDNEISAANIAPARPLPQETQNLILSVTGHMEFTSSHLLNRIPPTRTPSPVSVRDIHSPSPTPEPDIIEDTTPQLNTEQSRSKPTRPPPARPPRPAPPPRPQPPPQQIQTIDDINLFDAPAPQIVKPTKEDILSLYSVPKPEEKPVDFLSDDIPDMSQNVENTSTETNNSTEANPLLLKESNETENNNGNDDDGNFSMDVSEPTTGNANEISSSLFACVENEAVNQKSKDLEMNPFECSDEFIGATGFESIPVNIFGVTSEDINVSEASDVSQMTKNNEFNTTVADNRVDNQPMDIVTVDSKDEVTLQAENIFYSQPDTNIPQTGNDNNFGWGTEPMMQDTLSESQDVFPISNNVFPATNDVFTKTQYEGFPETHEGFSETPDPFSKTQDAFLESQEVYPESHDAFPESQDAFDAFSAKFDSANTNQMATDAWGVGSSSDAASSGFEAEAFDTFLTMEAPPPPAATPHLEHQGSRESTDDTFSVFIRPKENQPSGESTTVPVLAPPPRPQVLPDSPRANPFDQTADTMQQPFHTEPTSETGRARADSGGETPPTPLFDEDVSVPLEDFPRTKYTGPGWEMQLRQPNKKKITGQRFWKKVFVRLVMVGDSPAVQLLNSATDKEPLQELPLQACYSVSEIGAQQFDQFGKIFTVKLQYIFYKERPGVRPGQVTKAERITNKLSQFAAYAIQGDYQGVKEFGSDLRKLGLPVEHAPQVSQLFKIGSLNFEDVKQFSCCVEEALFKISAHRDRALTYKMEEVQITAVDELYVEQDAEGSVLKQIARVRLFFLSFLSGMPDVELGVNDLRRQGKEVVGRHDIIPVVTEEWIRVEDPEFHACVQPAEFDDTQIIKFKPPDACYIELMRFRVRPPKNRELPLQLKAVWCVIGNKVELRADVLVPGFASRKLGQVPCEDVAIRFPIPEAWIYLFRVEKHFRYGSVKSAHRRTGKIKGIERFLGAVDTLQESLIEVTSGQAKYEHQHRAIVWRMPRLPKEGQGAYTTHNLVCRMALTSYDQIPAELARWAHVEFTMPATQVSHMTVRSVSLQEHDSDPPEKYVRYLARHEYIVGIERTTVQQTAAYTLAANVPEAKREPAPAAAPTPPLQPPSSDSDSD